MKSKLKTVTLLAIAIASLLPNGAFAALTITGQAYQDTSIGLENGAHITSGGYAVLGYYGTTPTRTLLESYTSASQFLTGFTIAANGSTSGQGALGMDLGGVENYPAGYPALFSLFVDVPTGQGSGLLNKQFALIIGNGNSIATSTQLGVVSLSSWIISTNPDAPTPDAYTFDISAVGASPSGILFGSYQIGGGAYPLDNVTNQFKLQTVVPEPSTGALMMIGAAGLVALRRLRKV